MRGERRTRRPLVPSDAASSRTPPSRTRAQFDRRLPLSRTVPAKWTYRAIFRVADARAGQWSGPVSINVAP
jgi:hypothetical protein